MQNTLRSSGQSFLTGAPAANSSPGPTAPPVRTYVVRKKCVTWRPCSAQLRTNSRSSGMVEESGEGVREAPVGVAAQEQPAQEAPTVTADAPADAGHDAAAGGEFEADNGSRAPDAAPPAAAAATDVHDLLSKDEDESAPPDAAAATAPETAAETTTTTPGKSGSVPRRAGRRRRRRGRSPRRSPFVRRSPFRGPRGMDPTVQIICLGAAERYSSAAMLVGVGRFPEIGC